MHIDKKLCVALVTLLVVGCANKITQPVASIRLVTGDADSAFESVPQAVASNILNVPDGTDVSVGQQVVSVGKKYFSAAGIPCRRLDWKSNGEILTKGNAICKDKRSERWHFTQPVIATYDGGGADNG
ncbi:hypothetical protein [Lacimicrobium alkaliphilum]|uniref:Surface antigen domain-containing protein n=1 Tax=Lacimicrobium alkaliphilum TaxID=1526571 RepID=A0ABQ1R6R8_9ALTE|nr:hypothetical protein [Lacimicrobium alkaliphilum]GGD57750.1 hypothetical protein GCM10011357_11420 [Lacimicrobium alkaliphilum]